jgi:hypothetical protein
LVRTYFTHLLFQSRARGSLNRGVIRTDGNETCTEGDRTNRRHQLHDLHIFFYATFPSDAIAFPVVKNKVV